MDMIQQLTEEHRQVEQLLAELKESQPGDARYQTFRQLYTALAKHMMVEERFVYPLVAEAIDEDKERESLNEHELVRTGLASAYELLEEPGFVAAIESVEAGIEHHVQEEEQEIFPTLLKKKTSEEIEAMDPLELEGQVWPEAEVEIEHLFPAAEA